MANQKLTDRTLLAAALTLSDLVHIVDVSNTTQDSAGSSFKATMAQLKAIIAPSSVQGTGTENYVAKWDSGGVAILDSSIIDDGTTIGFNTVPSGSQFAFLANNSSIGISLVKTTGSDPAFNLTLQVGASNSSGFKAVSSASGSAGFLADISTGAAAGSHSYRSAGTAPIYFASSLGVGGDPYVFDDCRMIVATDGTSPLGAGHPANYDYVVRFNSSASVFANNIFNVLTNGKIGVHTISPAAHFHIAGNATSATTFLAVAQGTTSATYVMKLQDSTNSNLFTVRDDGLISMPELQTGNAGLTSGDLYKDTAANILAASDYVVGMKA